MALPSAPIVSVVSPVFHGRDTVAELARQIRLSLKGAGLSYEIILVEDGCPLDSWSAIREVCAQNPEIRAFRLACNVGQHRAIRAGLQRCRGDFVAVLDCDLQDDPAALPALVAKAREGFGGVYGRRLRRGRSSVRDAGARVFYRSISLLSGAPPFDPRRGMYTVFPRSTLQLLLARQDSFCRFLLTLHGLGLPAADVDVHRHPRGDRRSSYSWVALFRLSWEGMVSTNARSLRWMLPIGLAVTAAGLVCATLGAAEAGSWSSPSPWWREGGALAFALGIVVSGAGFASRRLVRIHHAPLEGEPYSVRESINEFGQFSAP